MKTIEQNPPAAGEAAHQITDEVHGSMYRHPDNLKAKHTPTPWRAIILSRKIEHEKPNQYAYPIQPVGGNFTVANVTLAYPALNGDHNKLDYAQGEANAAFIVRACNSHAALVEALKDMTALAAELGGETAGNARNFSQARAAITAAKGVQS